MTVGDPYEVLRVWPKWGAGISLARNQRLYDALNLLPWLNVHDAIKVTGSNGKGSVVAYTAAILTRIGLRTGSFTSPHLFDIGERVSIDGAPIPHDDLTRLLSRVAETARHVQSTGDVGSYGGFELMTAAALLWFQECDVDVAVIEAGVGGRYDVTRLIPGKTCAITSVDLEHTGILGNTLAEILCDKADIANPGGHIVLAGISERLRPLARKHTRDRNVEVSFLDDVAQISHRRRSEGLNRATISLENGGQIDAALTTPGAIQHQNAAHSIVLVDNWRRRNLADLEDAQFATAAAEGVAAARLRLRFEKLAGAPAIYADVCHTPDAAHKCAQTAKEVFGGQNPILIVGVSKTKDADGVISALAPIAHQIIFTAAQHEGRAPQSLVSLGPNHREILSVAETAPEAIAIARKASEQDKGRPILIAGGLFLAVEASETLAGRDANALAYL